MEYDVIVVGSGPGGYSAAGTAGHYGLKVAIIEKEYFGGVCLNVGCIPTKTLLKSAKVYGFIKHAGDYGIEVNTNVKLNWDLMQKRKNEVVRKLVKGVESLLKGSKADIIKGTGIVIDKNTVRVGKTDYKAKNIIISTGSTPVMLPLPGFEEAYKKGYLLTSTEALKVEKIPKSIVVVGGGVIGVEFAALFSELGSKVTMIQGMPTILEMLDADVSKEMARILKEKGVEIIVNAMVKGVKGKSTIYEVDGKEHSVKSDHMLLAVGRRPNTKATEKLDIKINQRKQYEIDENMETSIPGIYAIGDCSSPLMLAHVAYRQADIAVAHLTNLERGKFKLEEMPWCIYCYPEASGIGKTEQELKKEGVSYLKVKLPMKHLGKALADGDSAYGFYKLMVGSTYGEILGCHIVGSTASDMIAEIAVAMKLESTVFEMASTTHPHPSVSEIAYEAAKTLAFMLDKLKRK